jgi:hypothetical protein
VVWLVAAALVVFLPEGMIRWFLPKETVFALAVFAAAVASGRGRVPRWMVVAIGAAVVLLLVGVASSASPWAAVWGSFHRVWGR